MSTTRRSALSAFLFSAMPAIAQQSPTNERPPIPADPDEDLKLPNGKSQKDAVAKQAHEDALKEVESLIHLAEDLRDELKRSSQYVVAVSSVRKTEEIEKLARHIRGKLKA